MVDASGKEDNLWAVFSSVTGNQIITINQVQKHPVTGETRFVPCEVGLAPAELRNLRTHKNGFLALDFRGSWWSATVSEGRISWARIAQPADRETIRTGQQVIIDIPGLSWKASPIYLGDGQAPLVVHPPEYGLFVEEAAGAALAMDVVTSVSVDSKKRRVALGTKGGVFEGPFCKDGDQLLLARKSIMFTSDLPATPGCVLNVRSVRHDSNGVLYARFGTGGRIARLMENGVWFIEGAQMPDERIEGARRQVAIDTTGLWIDGKRVHVSNDLFGFERRPISDVVAHAFDVDTQTLWLCERQAGLFKALLERVPSRP